MLAMAEASWAGICDLVIFGMVNAAMIRMIVTTISNSISVKPRSRLYLDMSVPHENFAELCRCKDAGQALFVSAMNKELLSTAVRLSKPGPYRGSWLEPWTRPTPVLLRRGGRTESPRGGGAGMRFAALGCMVPDPASPQKSPPGRQQPDLSIIESGRDRQPVLAPGRRLARRANRAGGQVLFAENFNRRTSSEAGGIGGSQHTRESRVNLRPFRLPSTVTAMASRWNISLAACTTSSRLTSCTFAMISFMPMK